MGEEGRRVPTPLFHFCRTNRPRPPTGKDTDAFLHLHLTYTPKQRERKTGIRDTGRRGRHIPSHPSIHPSIPPSAIKRGRASSDLFLPAPRPARGRPCPSSPVLLRHRRRIVPQRNTKKKHPFNPISRRAPSVDRQPGSGGGAPSPPFPSPLFLSPICLLSGERLTHTTGGGGGGNRRKGAWKEEKSFGPLPPLPPQNSRGKGGFCQSSQSRR